MKQHSLGNVTVNLPDDYAVLDGLGKSDGTAFVILSSRVSGDGVLVMRAKNPHLLAAEMVTVGNALKRAADTAKGQMGVN